MGETFLFAESRSLGQRQYVNKRWERGDVFHSPSGWDFPSLEPSASPALGQSSKPSVTFPPPRYFLNRMRGVEFHHLSECQLGFFGLVVSAANPISPALLVGFRCPDFPRHDIFISASPIRALARTMGGLRGSIQPRGLISPVVLRWITSRPIFRKEHSYNLIITGTLYHGAGEKSITIFVFLNRALPIAPQRVTQILPAQAGSCQNSKRRRRDLNPRGGICSPQPRLSATSSENRVRCLGAT